MRKRIKPTCPHCGSHVLSGWYNEHDLCYVVRCEQCGKRDEVVNIKYVEAFPEWFEILDEEGPNEAC